MTAALRQAFDGRPPGFLLRGLRLTADNPECRAFTREDLLALQRPPTDISRDDSDDGRSIAPIIAPCVPSVGAEFNLAVAKTMQARGFRPPALPLLALAPPSPCPILIRGVATTVAIDEMRTMVGHNAIAWTELPPILLRHGEPCGECLSLEYSPMGDTLTLTARIDLEEARRMPALSVNVEPLAYEFMDKGLWHWRITKARLVEISVTDRPCLRSALIEVRTAAPAPIEDPRYRALGVQMARLRLALAA